MVFRLVSFLVTMVILISCSQGLLKRPKTPPKKWVQQEQKDEANEQEKDPLLTAPPPAYGNKVVLKD